jgi:general secretion pathway protein G
MFLTFKMKRASLTVRRFGHRDGASHSGEAGFTLIEMLVVITIIGLIMALVGPRVLSYLSDSKVKAAKIQMESFESALDLYYLDNGSYPASNEGLKALVQRPASAAAWNGPYLKASAVPDDPWGHPYLYKVPGDHSPYEIASYGTGRTGDTQTMIRSTTR